MFLVFRPEDETRVITQPTTGQHDNQAQFISHAHNLSHGFCCGIPRSDTWACTWSWSHVTLRILNCLEYYLVAVVSPLSYSVVSLPSFCIRSSYLERPTFIPDYGQLAPFRGNYFCHGFSLKFIFSAAIFITYYRKLNTCMAAAQYQLKKKPRR
jgi:hypothetical protein